jgi:hypothetical protein
MDDRYRDIAEDIPGFGGLFVDEGILQVYLTPDAFREVLGSDELPYGELLRLEDMPQLQESLISHLSEQIIEGTKNGAVIREGAYDYRDLLDWRTRAHNLITSESFVGFSSFDVAEDHNRIVLGIDFDWRQELGLPLDIPDDILAREMEALEIPVSAVEFEFATIADPWIGLQGK